MIFVNPFSRVNTDIPNISLAYTATKFGAQVIDFNTLPRPKETILQHQADLLGISVRSMNTGEAEEIASMYLNEYPNTPIVSVGCGIDIQCCYPFHSWERHLSFPFDFSDKYPFPDYELFDSFDLFQKNWQSGKWKYALMTSLGCPFPCNYCMCRKRKWLPRSAQNSVAELEQAKDKWGISSFVIIDDCFNVNHKRCLDFATQVKNLNLTWECANGLRADLFSEELAQTLADSGCIQVSFGIESIHDDILKQINKGEDFAAIEKAVEIATRYFPHVNGFFIIGLPGSSLEKDRQSLEWAQMAGINAHFSYFVPSLCELPENEVFYGTEAKPLGDAYPKEEQQRFYQETAQMRPIPAEKPVSL